MKTYLLRSNYTEIKEESYSIVTDKTKGPIEIFYTFSGCVLTFMVSYSRNLQYNLQPMFVDRKPRVSRCRSGIRFMSTRDDFGGFAK